LHCKKARPNCFGWAFLMVNIFFKPRSGESIVAKEMLTSKKNPVGVKDSFTSSSLVFFTLNYFDFQLLTLLLSFLAKKKEAKKVAFFAKTNSWRQRSCHHFKQVFAVSYPFGMGVYAYSALATMRRELRGIPNEK
jgi:hypothetical protein